MIAVSANVLCDECKASHVTKNLTRIDRPLLALEWFYDELRAAGWLVAHRHYYPNGLTMVCPTCQNKERTSDGQATQAT